jgi:hypothetical protein
VQPDPSGLQRQAVIDQLAPAEMPAGAQPRPGLASPAMPGARPQDAFSRGGEVKQLPGMGGEQAERLARTGLSVAGTAAGAFNPVTIGTNFAADKLKVKEEMPTFGGEFGHLTDDYGRRFEGTGGGIASNAVRYAGYGAMAGPIGAGVGALAGAIKGAVTKNAPSAYTDFRVEDAADAIQKGYQEYLGRPASEDEIRTHLTNVGWDEKDGDRWTGEKALYHILGTLKNSDEAKQFATRGAVVDQLDSGAAAPYDNTPGSDIGPTTTFGGGSVMATTNKQNEDTLARQPANTQRWTGTAAGAEPTASQVAPGATRDVTGPGIKAPADGAAGGTGTPAAPVDASAWNTDGYAAPQVTAAGFREQAPAGWDQAKWNDPNHQTPKYVWGRLTQDSNPNDVEQLLAAYPGSSFNGKDKVTIPGVGTIDIFKGASVGLNEPQWLAEGSASGAAPQAGGGASGGMDLSSQARGIDAGGGDTLAAIKAELARILANQPNRDALLAQMGGS